MSAAQLTGRAHVVPGPDLCARPGRGTQPTAGRTFEKGYFVTVSPCNQPASEVPGGSGRAHELHLELDLQGTAVGDPPEGMPMSVPDAPGA